MGRPNRALRRLLLPTLLRPRKATSEKGEGGKERKYGALKRRVGGVRVKKAPACLRWAFEGGVEMS